MTKLKRMVLGFGLVFTLAFSVTASAQELRVSAPVLSVEPIKSQPKPICDVPAPDKSAGLAAALRWDLRGRCRESPGQAQITGYAVEYQWDGRRFTTVLAEPPAGDRLALRLQLQ